MALVQEPPARRGCTEGTVHMALMQEPSAWAWRAQRAVSVALVQQHPHLAAQDSVMLIVGLCLGDEDCQAQGSQSQDPPQFHGLQVKEHRDLQLSKSPFSI